MRNDKFIITNTLMSLLEQTARIEKAIIVRYFNENKNFDISFNEFIILTIIQHLPGIHQRNLAKKALIGTANLSRELDKLETKKLITRNADTKAKRVVKMLYTTDIGNKKCNDIAVSMKNFINKTESIYTKEEQALFNEFLLRMKNKLTESIDMVIE